MSRDSVIVPGTEVASVPGATLSVNAVHDLYTVRRDDLIVHLAITIYIQCLHCDVVAAFLVRIIEGLLSRRWSRYKEAWLQCADAFYVNEAGTSIDAIRHLVAVQDIK